jgi:hypothetical protein
MGGMRSGVQYSARKVIAARALGSGVILTVSTDDQHGRALSSFDEEENIPGLGTPGTPSAILFPNGPTAVSYAQAQFVSSRGYAFLLAQPQLARFRLDSDRPNVWSVAVSAPSLNYIVAPGVPKRAIADLTAVTGRQPAPPAWALGPMLDRLVKNSGETQSDYESKLNQDADGQTYTTTGTLGQHIALLDFTNPAAVARPCRRTRSAGPSVHQRAHAGPTRSAVD